MNGFSAAVASPPIAPLNSTSEISRPPLPTTRPEFSSFKFKTIGQPPTLLSRLSGAGAASDYRTPSPEPSDMDITPSDDPPMMVSEGNRTVTASRKSLLDTLGENADHTGHNSTIATARTQDPGVLEPTFTSPLSASSSNPNPTLPRPESRLSSDFRGLSVAADVSRAEASLWPSVAPGTYAHESPDSDMADLYADPDSPSRFPLSLFSDLSEAVRESAELDRITTLHHQLSAEREELLTRHDETTRALSRTKTQLDRVLSLTDEAIKITTVFVDKEKTRLDIKKTKVETRIEHKKNLETERRKAKELERIRQHEEEQKAQIEMEQQAERQRLEEQRKKEETLAAERKRQEEIQARERAQAEERRRLEEEERQRLAEDQRRREDEERKRRAEEEQQKEEEERLCKRLAEEREALARKQEEDRRNQLLERRRLAEEERKQKEAQSAAAKAEAEKQVAEQKIFQQRRATALKDKWKNYNRPESGVPPTGSPPSILEGTSSSNLPSITVNDAPANPHAVTEHYPGFVPATTEAGRLPPDLSQKVKISDSLIDYAVKHEATSPVIVPVDNDQPMEDNPPTQLSSRSVSSMSTSAPAPVPAPLPAPPHLPQKPVTLHSKPPVPIQQSGRSPRRYSTQRSRSRSRSSSPRRGSPSPRMPLRASRSPDAARGRYKSPPSRRKVDHYSPPRPSYRGGGSRYERDSRSDSPPPPPPPNSRKRALQVSEDSWAKASTPSKLDYSHPSKRRAVSPLRSRTPPSPPPIVPSRRLPRSGGRGRGGGPPQSQNHLSLEQRLSRQLSERIQ